MLIVDMWKCLDNGGGRSDGITEVCREFDIKNESFLTNSYNYVQVQHSEL